MHLRSRDNENVMIFPRIVTSISGEPDEGGTEVRSSKRRGIERGFPKGG